MSNSNVIINQLETHIHALKRLDFWLNLVDEDLHCFYDINRVRNLFNTIILQGAIRHYELPNEEGVIVYMISDNFRGANCVNEIFMYIKKEHRGNIRLFKKLVNHLEQVARENDCKSVKIASNIGYNDDSVLKCLQRFGYKTDVVTKEIQ